MAKQTSGNLARFTGTRARVDLNDLLAPGDYAITVSPAGTLKDDGGNALAPTTFSFTVPADGLAPTVTSVYSTATQLFVSFSEDVASTASNAANPASYTSTAPALTASLSGMTEANQGEPARNAALGPFPASLDDTGMTFSYSTPLPVGTYTLHIAGISDIRGNLMAPTDVTFTVR